MRLNTKEVFGYVSPAMKRRLKSLCKKNPQLSESKIVRDALEQVVPTLEREVENPTQEEPADGHGLLVGA
jgi:hypothetical protein